MHENRIVQQQTHVVQVQKRFRRTHARQQQKRRARLQRPKRFFRFRRERIPGDQTIRRRVPARFGDGVARLRHHLPQIRKPRVRFRDSPRHQIPPSRFHPFYARGAQRVREGVFVLQKSAARGFFLYRRKSRAGTFFRAVSGEGQPPEKFEQNASRARMRAWFSAPRSAKVTRGVRQPPEKLERNASRAKNSSSRAVRTAEAK